MDRTQLKTEGVAFGRVLQTGHKSVVMYSGDHPAVERAAQQAFEALNSMLQYMPQLIFGFMNGRLLLNDFLTSEPTLRLLDAEFARRGIAAVTFMAGISLAEFRQTLNILAAKPREIEEAGGLAPFLAAHPLGGVRIAPVKKSEDGDTILGMDTESYLMAGDDLPPQRSQSGKPIDVLLHCAQVERAFSAPPSGTEILELAGKAAETAFLDQATDPKEIAKALARVLEEVTPERFLAALPAGKQSELRGQPAADVADDVMEDVTVGWVTKRLAAAHQNALTPAAEEEALRVMMVGLNMTRMVDRLLQKLARTLGEANLPPTLYERIRQGIVWNSLSQREKHERLLQTARFDDQQFRYLFDYVRESLRARKIPEAIQAAAHYFVFLDAPSATVQEELPRALELLRVMVEPVTLPFISTVVEHLGAELLNDRHPVGECHGLLAAVLIDLVQMAPSQENFEIAHRVGTALERSRARDPGRHADCCGASLPHLLPPDSAGRLIDLYMEKRGDSGLTKAAVELLTWLGPVGGEEVFSRLIEEAVAPNRVLLLRLLTQLGSAGIEAARKRLSDGRWYVVRNACYVLGDLSDPDLPQALRGALQHKDIRVQRAALVAIVKCQSPESATVLTEALPALEAGLAEKAIEELSFRKDPATIDGLEQFIRLGKETRPGAIAKAVHALAVIPSERALGVLGAVLSDLAHVPMVRRAAADILTRSPQPIARLLLEEFVRRTPSDPLAPGIRRALERDGSR
jgi:HEAT repeats